jgi:hypothetical protein
VKNISETLTYEAASTACYIRSFDCNDDKSLAERQMGQAEILFNDGWISPEVRDRLQAEFRAAMDPNRMWIRYNRPLVRFSRLRDGPEEIGELLRQALIKAEPHPDDLHGPDLETTHPIDLAAYAALDAIKGYIVVDDLVRGGYKSQAAEGEWWHSRIEAYDRVRKHELLLVIKRIGRLRSPWRLRPCAQSAYLLDLVTRDEPEGEEAILTIDASLPRQQVRALIDAYEAGVKRGKAIVLEEVVEGTRRAKWWLA